MVICRNENLIKRAAEVVLNNLTARGRIGTRRRRVSGDEGKDENSFFPVCTTLSLLFCSPVLFFGLLWLTFLFHFPRQVFTIFHAFVPFSFGDSCCFFAPSALLLSFASSALHLFSTVFHLFSISCTRHSRS